MNAWRFFILPLWLVCGIVLQFLLYLWHRRIVIKLHGKFGAALCDGPQG